MPSDEVDKLNMSQLSLSSSGSQSEDWDRSLSLDDSLPPTPSTEQPNPLLSSRTPRNSVVFPKSGGNDQATPKGAKNTGTRSLSELLKLHAEKGTETRMSTEEAARVADVLGQWVSTLLTIASRYMTHCGLDQHVVLPIRGR